MIDYTIISTGSKGNAVVINGNILIDCGVSFKSLKNVYKGLQIVLLTHEHGDHFNRTTIKKLAIERPILRFGCCEWMVKPLVEYGINKHNIDVFFDEHEHIYKFGDIGVCISPINLQHNKPNCGYSITSSFGKLFYATDTNSLDGITAKNYDLYLVEANYSEVEIVERIKEKQAAGQYCHEWDVLKNHLSKEKADNWLYKNIGSNSQYAYLHQHE